MLERQPGMVVVGEASNAETAVAAVADGAADVVILDLRMPGGAIDAIRRLRRESDHVGIVVYTAYEDPTDAEMAFKAGARAFVLKRAPSHELLTAVKKVAGRERYVDSSIAGELMRRLVEEPPDPNASEHVPRLSAREKQVLVLVARGHSHREIAEMLKLHVKSIETYRARATDKLGLTRRAELVRYALHAGLLDSELRDIVGED